jgi:hypothetical protein
MVKKIDASHLKKLLSVADSNHDGHIDQKEWSNMFDKMMKKFGAPDNATINTIEKVPLPPSLMPPSCQRQDNVICLLQPPTRGCTCFPLQKYQCSIETAIMFSRAFFALLGALCIEAAKPDGVDFGRQRRRTLTKVLTKKK